MRTNPLGNHYVNLQTRTWSVLPLRLGVQNAVMGDKATPRRKWIEDNVRFIAEESGDMVFWKDDKENMGYNIYTTESKES